MNLKIIVSMLASVLLAILVSCSSNGTGTLSPRGVQDYIDIYCYPFNVKFVLSPSDKEIITKGGHIRTESKEIISIFEKVYSSTKEGRGRGRCILIKNKADRLYVTKNWEIMDSVGKRLALGKLQQVALMREVDKALGKISKPLSIESSDISSLADKLNPLLFHYNEIDFCVPRENTDTAVETTQKVKNILQKNKHNQSIKSICEALTELYPCKTQRRKDKRNACKIDGHPPI